MRKPIAIGAASILALAGCDGGASGGSNVTRMTADTSAYHDQLKAAPDLNRQLALMRAIRDTGHRCKAVEQTAHQQGYENLQMWTARCRDGRAWAVFIAPNGDLQVRNCDEMQQLGLPECRIEAAEEAA